MRGVGGGNKLLEGGNYFKYFCVRAAIIRGRQLIKGWLLFKEISYFVFLIPGHGCGKT